jgi:cytoskeletal protein CcmA (bactofilin family)
VAVSRLEGATRTAAQAGAGLHDQLDHLGLDDELRHVVGEGLRRLPKAEQEAIASDLQLAVSALRPALAQLQGSARSSGSTVRVGATVVLKGELTAHEDVTISGRVEGRIEAPLNVVTIAQGGKVVADVIAKSVVVIGSVVGNVTASHKVDIRDGGSIDGDVRAPSVAIAESAHFRGSIDMQRSTRRDVSVPVPAADIVAATVHAPAVARG